LSGCIKISVFKNIFGLKEKGSFKKLKSITQYVRTYIHSPLKQAADLSLLAVGWLG
jgi:hypothetical protein